MNKAFINNGLKGIRERIISDGVYVISTDSSYNQVLSIIGKSVKPDESLNFAKKTNEAYQFFIIKYNDQFDYYTIMALHSHLYLGVEKKGDSNYNNTLIMQNPMTEDYLAKWEIIFDDGYYFQLKDLNYNLQYKEETKICIIAKKNNTNFQRFYIKTFDVFTSGLYYINTITPKNAYITLSKDEKQPRSFLNSKNQNEDQLFYIVFDDIDGCYSIININNLNCLSPGKDPKLNTKIKQTTFYNLDYQKWIIGTNDGKTYFILLKSDDLLLSNNPNSNINEKPDLYFRKFNDINQSTHNFYFNFQSGSSLYKKIMSHIFSQDQNFKESVNKIKEILKFRYNKQIFDSNLIERASNIINSQLFENSLFLNYLEIPTTIDEIHKEALINCFRIKSIKCDPKWLKLLPNPANVENIVVPNGVESIDKSSFKKFCNLKYLSLPDSLKFENCDQKLFKRIYGLKIFVGDPKFLYIIHKDELTTVNIPYFVKEIPEKACAGCKSLKEVVIEENSQLKIINSKAFAGCNLLRFLSIPDSVNNIAPNAFKGCNKDFHLGLKNEIQKISMIKKLVIDKKVTKITNDYKRYINIKEIEIPEDVHQCDNDVLKSFDKLKYVKCDPKWLNDFNTNKIEIVSIPDNITNLEKKDFENLVHLKLVEIPESVKEIEEGTFDNCIELTSVKCGTCHFKFLNQKKIRSVCLNDDVKKINESDFREFINLESLKINDEVTDIDPKSFLNCKKLMIIDHPNGKSFINNSYQIDENKTEISKEDFEGWTNLERLIIPKSITKIDEDSFKDCTNIKKLTCDPKWFPFLHVDSIRKVVIPDFVTELKKGQFDGFSSMSVIRLPKQITIEDPTIFDSCENLRIIKCRNSIFAKFSDKTIERCDAKLKTKYENPIFNFQPDLSRVIDETELIPNDELDADGSLSLSNSMNTSLFQTKRLKEDIIPDDLVAFDPSANYYKSSIENVLNYISSSENKLQNEPKDTSISEISNICGSICHLISQKLNITPRVVQIYTILRLADEILNKDSHGSISELKPGEGKSLVMTILTIILVKYNRTVDITTSNMKFAKRYKTEQSGFFELFHIQTSVFNDQNVENSSPNFKEYDKNEFNNSSLRAFDCPVVYSTNRNFEYYYLHTLFSMIPRKRELDIVLIDGVDNMLIDELDSPAVISKEINFALSNNIFRTLYTARYEKISKIAKILSDEFPNASDFNLHEIELLRNAALEADHKKKNVDYIVEKKKVKIIDHETGFRMPNSHWPNYVLQMVNVKELIKPKFNYLSLCQVTQQSYFNLYKKIAGITGTFGSKSDEQIVKDGYNVNTFKVPRNISSKIDVYYKTRPELIEEIFDVVSKEIQDERITGRPILVIWDSKNNSEKFFNFCNLGKVSKIYGINQESDEEAIKSAGELHSLTLTTSTAIRGIDIDLSKKALKFGGLHVIIPMKISNLRSLEQHVGITGKQGEPGSVSLYISKEDLYIKTPSFHLKNENLVKIQSLFAKYIKDYFPWMISGPRKYNIDVDITFPFAANYSDIFSILSAHIFLVFNESQTLSETKRFNKFQDLSWILVQTAWGSFFTNMQNDKLNNDNWTFCEREYHRFIKELNHYFSPNESKTIFCALNYFNTKFASEKNNEYIIYKGFKISLSGVILLPVNNNNDQDDNLTLDSSQNTGNESFFKRLKNDYNWVKTKIIENRDRIPGIGLLNKTPKVGIKQFKISFIKKTLLVLASESYDGTFSIGRVIFSSEINELYKPKFYCIEHKNKLFVVTRGSASDADWMTDFMCEEIYKNIEGADFYFHKGFYTAARYILSNISEFIERDYDEIYFVGHSYAAAVSNVLCLLTKLHKSLKDKNIFSFAFAPPPSMSRVPAFVQDCMFSFINKSDIVPHLSLNNIKNTVSVENLSLKDFIENKLVYIKAIRIEYAQMMAKFIEKYKDDMFRILDSVNNDFHVHKNIGNIFFIGISGSKKLTNCLVDETDLKNVLFFVPSMFSDHYIDQYVKSFEIIESY